MNRYTRMEINEDPNEGLSNKSSDAEEDQEVGRTSHFLAPPLLVEAKEEETENCCELTIVADGKGNDGSQTVASSDVTTLMKIDGTEKGLPVATPLMDNGGAICNNNGISILPLATAIIETTNKDTKTQKKFPCTTARKAPPSTSVARAAHHGQHSKGPPPPPHCPEGGIWGRSKYYDQLRLDNEYSRCFMPRPFRSLAPKYDNGDRRVYKVNGQVYTSIGVHLGNETKIDFCLEEEYIPDQQVEEQEAFLNGWKWLSFIGALLYLIFVKFAKDAAYR